MNQKRSLDIYPNKSIFCENVPHNIKNYYPCIRVTSAPEWLSGDLAQRLQFCKLF
jgi:hypothetical protein